MPAKDLYHDTVRNALIRDGWTITHDPYTLAYGLRKVFVDLGAEPTLAAEKGGRKIAVEIKSFLGASDLRDLENALGQYVFYRSLLVRIEPDRELYLAVTEDAYDNTFTDPIARPPLEDLSVRLVVFEPAEGEDYPMDSVITDRRIIRDVIQGYAQHRPSVGDVEIETIFDEANDHYELIYSGWSGRHRIHGSVIHVDIRGGKILIQYDGTHDGIAHDLVAAGIPRDRIILAFKPPEIRPHTGFAAV